MAEEDQKANAMSLNVIGPDVIDISPLKDGGVLKKILVEGDINGETPSVDSEIICYFTISLSDGSLISTIGMNRPPYIFRFGLGQDIPAWDIALATMKKGEKAIITAKPEYAYGVAGCFPYIPHNETINLEIELLDWQLKDLSPNQDKGILKKTLTKGTENHSPEDGAMTKVHLVGKFEGRVFEDRDLEFPYGDGVLYKLCNGIETAIGSLRLNEKSIVYIQSDYAYGEEGNAEYNIPPKAKIEYEVELKAFEVAKTNTKMKFKDILDLAMDKKGAGTRFYTLEHYEPAFKKYKKAAELLEPSVVPADEADEEDKEQHHVLLIQCRLNAALCYLKLQKYSEALESCDLALILDPGNEKGLFRRGQANFGLNNFESAKEDYEGVLKVNPNNTAATQEIAHCVTAIQRNKIKERDFHSSIFKK